MCAEYHQKIKIGLTSCHLILILKLHFWWENVQILSLCSMLENHCTQTAQSSHGGCSRRVHKIVYLAVKKGNILVNILLQKIFIVNYCHL